MDDRPRNLKSLLSEAKDTSELMVDLAYAALYFGDPDMAEEVDELEQRLSELVHEMRSPDTDTLERLAQACEALARQIGERRQIGVEVKRMSEFLAFLDEKDSRSVNA